MWSVGKQVLMLFRFLPLTALLFSLQAPADEGRSRYAGDPVSPGAGYAAFEPCLAPNAPTLEELAYQATVFSQKQLSATVAEMLLTEYPSYTIDYIDWVTKDSGFWTSGFFPGCLWKAYEETGDPSWRTWAEDWTAGLEDEKHNTTTHDIGFMLFTSFGNGFHLTQEPSYKEVLLQAAESLATRFNHTVGCLRSWDWGSWQFPVIIDNMMNLELLFWAASNGGLTQWYDMAASHAMKTLEHHLRPDGSTFHLVDFDPGTGDIISKSTWQGYSADSTWARGQAWALYGFSMVYRETEDAVFLEAARKAADFYIDHLPEDFIPYWDFDAPGIPGVERDTSAAAIAASGLFELSALEIDTSRKMRYLQFAKWILRSLCLPDSSSGYLAKDQNNDPLSPGLLMHGCYNHPDSYSHGEVPDENLIWGDYYFLEALQRFEDF